MLNESRVKSNAPKDLMQDYDVVFFITRYENVSHIKQIVSELIGLVNLLCCNKMTLEEWLHIFD